MKSFLLKTLIGLLFTLSFKTAMTQKNTHTFRVISFYTAKSDLAHISFVHEANRWFSKMATLHGFTYDSTDNWDNMNSPFLTNYDLVIFFDTRPDKPEQRAAFQQYIETGGGWIGFHFAGFALTPSDFNQDWDWYHNTFLGVGSYKGNTWHPTPAFLKVEDRKHPTMKGLPKVFKSAPNEWYSWEKDIRENKDIKILLSIDPSSFPLGNGPKQHEIWHEGYYPVAWTNINYRMLYMNMGHNDIDYDHGTNKELSFQFDNEMQNKFVLNTVMWLGGVRRSGRPKVRK